MEDLNETKAFESLLLLKATRRGSNTFFTYEQNNPELLTINPPF